MMHLWQHCKQAEGFDYLALSDPHTGKKLHRVGWVAFVPGTDMKAAESTLGESKVSEDLQSPAIFFLSND